jgi:8-oxo-dGTP pyrophosphatase MutT (NUDIX family)
VTDAHDWLAAALEGFSPIDPSSAAAVATVRTAVAALAVPFSETASPTHVTASGFVVGTRGIILLEHRRLGIWVQPGGHVDPGEVPPEAAVREAVEETGLPCVHVTEPPRLVRVDVHPGPRGHTHLDLGYLLVAPDDDPHPPAEESQVLGWFDRAAALDRAEPALARYLVHLFVDLDDHPGTRGWGSRLPS